MSCAYSPLQAAIVVDVKTGEVLYSNNADCKTQPASLVKVMSLFIAFHALSRKKIKSHTMMKVSHHAASQRPSSLGLKANQLISCRDAVLAMITKSANDASVVLAEHIGGTEARFVQIMNAEARRLSMNCTQFVNSSGWKDRRQAMTARDVAKLSLTIIRKYPKFFTLFSTKNFKYNGINYRNHNHMLGEKNGVRIDGIKTGFVYASGFNISVSASKGNKRIIVVVLGGRTAKKRDDEVRQLIDYAFHKLERRQMKRIQDNRSIFTRIRDLFTPNKPRHGLRIKKNNAIKETIINTHKKKRGYVGHCKIKHAK